MSSEERTRSEETDNDEVAEEEHDLPGATSRTLEEALEQAIKDENYELAAQIRDQINSRNKKSVSNIMHVFYTPDIQKSNELPEEEAQHCIRVLRLSIGDEITLTDGKGNFYKAEITVATNKRCFVNIKETIFQEPLWPCHLHCHGTNEEYGPQRMVCRESYRNRF